MSNEIVVEALKRTELGKNASRRLRRQGMVPAVLYGDEGDAVPLTLSYKSLEEVLHSEAGANTLFGLKLKPGGVVPGKVMIKVQELDPVTEKLLHADLMRIAMDKEIRVQVAIHTIGVAKGVKLQGGILDHPLREVEVECLPGDIPEKIDLDISELELGKGYRVSDLRVPEGVKIITDASMPVVTVAAPTVEKVEEPVAAGAPEAAAPTEPELIKKGKAETAEGETPEGSRAGDKGGSSEKK